MRNIFGIIKTLKEKSKNKNLYNKLGILGMNKNNFF
jgi:hypothetical protein